MKKKKKKLKAQTELHDVVMSSGEEVGLYVDGKLLVKCTPAIMMQIEVNKN